MTFTEDLALVIGAEVLDEDVACEGKAEDKQWLPIPKLGCLVKGMKIKSLEEIYLFSLQREIIEFFLGHPLRMRFQRSCQCRSRRGLAIGPGSVFCHYWGLQ